MVSVRASGETPIRTLHIHGWFRVLSSLWHRQQANDKVAGLSVGEKKEHSDFGRDSIHT
jgi:hypothetical protein